MSFAELWELGRGGGDWVIDPSKGAKSLFPLALGSLLVHGRVHLASHSLTEIQDKHGNDDENRDN